MDGNTRTFLRTMRGALVAAALLGTATGGHAAPQVQGAPDADAFATHFEPLPEPRPELQAEPGAVDIAAIEPPVEAEPEARSIDAGMASYYASHFNGRRTASGERFSNAQMTAAHRTLPFGSKVRVTNPDNGRSVIVRINDRGPFTRGRVIDLSRAAAEQIGMIQRGHARVQLALLEG